MKITERKGVLDPQLAGADPVRPESRATVVGDSVTGDRVNVSDTARQLAGLRAAIGDVDGVRPERVAVLQAAIDAGRYAPDASDVARAVLRNAVG
jgi:flagellar biosynthesis anti-sigma factor FlgM